MKRREFFKDAAKFCALGVVASVAPIAVLGSKPEKREPRVTQYEWGFTTDPNIKVFKRNFDRQSFDLMLKAMGSGPIDPPGALLFASTVADIDGTDRFKEMWEKGNRIEVEDGVFGDKKQFEKDVERFRIFYEQVPLVAEDPCFFNGKTRGLIQKRIDYLKSQNK